MAVNVFRLALRPTALASRSSLFLRCAATSNEPVAPPRYVCPEWPVAPKGFFHGAVNNMMKEKLGASGIWTLSIGGALFLVSKEYYICNAETTVAIGMAFTYGSILYMITPIMVNKLLQQGSNVIDHFYYRKQKVLDALQGGIRAMDDVEEQISVRHDVFDVLRTNAAMHREALYRTRVSQVHEEVLKRLMHQAELESSRRGNIQKHMVKWVERQVLAGITPELEKQIVERCITDLKSMSAA